MRCTLLVAGLALTAGTGLALAWLARSLATLQDSVLRLAESTRVQESVLKPLAETIRQLHGDFEREEDLLKSCLSWVGQSLGGLSDTAADLWPYVDDVYDGYLGDGSRRRFAYSDYGAKRGLYSYDSDYFGLDRTGDGRRRGAFGSTRLGLDYGYWADDYDYDYDYSYGLDRGFGVYGRSRATRAGLQRLLRNRTRALEAALRQPPPEARPSSSAPWRIPRILHQTWKTEEMPAKYTWHVASWRRLHPTWRFEFWDDKRSRRLVMQHFPQFAEEYDRMSGIKRADVARIAILHVFGGVYADIDVEATRPLDSLLEAAEQVGAGVLLGEENFVHSVLLEQRSEWLVSNAVMAGSKGHAFWLQALREIFQNVWCGEDPVQCTGPRLVDRLSWEHVRRHPACPRRGSELGCLVRLPFAYFSPNIARWNAHNMIRECRYQGSAVTWSSGRGKRGTLVQRACRSLQNALDFPSALQSEQTYAVHHWQCSWCRKDSTMEHTVPLCEIEWQVGNESLEGYR